MSRLPRPPISLAVKLTITLRQNGCSIDVARERVENARKERKLGVDLEGELFLLAATLGCPRDQLRLDHNPALENREKLVLLLSGRTKLVVIVPNGAKVLRYFPDANDPEYMIYRPHSPEFAGSHLIKTNVSGDGAQHSDRAMAAKNKNIARNRDPKRRKAKIRSASRWPPRGSRKIQNKKRPLELSRNQRPV